MQLHSIPRLDLTRLLSFNGGTVGNTAAFAGGCRQDSGECSKLLDLNCDSAISGMMKQPIHALFTCLLDTSDLDEQSLWGDAVSAFSLTAAHTCPSPLVVLISILSGGDMGVHVSAPQQQTPLMQRHPAATSCSSIVDASLSHY